MSLVLSGRAGRPGRWGVGAAAALVMMLAATPGHAQRRAAPPDIDVEAPGGVSAAELQQLFDAYALMQAQEALQVSDDQYPRFLARLRALQEARRRHQVERLRALQQLRRLVQEPRSRSTDDRIREQLKDLRALSDRGAADIARAVDDIDEVLDPAQQARLRLFEEQMERRKLDLLMRARRGARGRMRP
jgi:hypothetical protein